MTAPNARRGHMFVYKRLIAAMLAGTCAACQGLSVTPDLGAGSTAIEVSGVVEIFPGGHGLGHVTLDDGRCYDLALPASVLKNSNRWDTKQVVIAGPVLYRPRLDAMMWVDIQDRRIEGFGCSEDVIYVESIRKR